MSLRLTSQSSLEQSIHEDHLAIGVRPVTPDARQSESFAAYAQRALQEWSPIIVSNRAPYEPTATGGTRRGSGGLVSALLGVAEATGAIWVACARTEGERRLAAASGALIVSRRGQRTLNIRHAQTGSDSYSKYYSVIANPLLWFVQHYLWQLAYEPVIDERVHEAWRTGYVTVNQGIAGEIAIVAGQSEKQALVLFQDYQLYLAPRMVRTALPHAVLQHFVHIPWPTPQYWTVLPKEMREGILDGLLANDVIGFQTTRDVRNFLATCEELMGLRVDNHECAVLYRGRVSWVRAYPVSVDVCALRRMASSSEVEAEDSLLGRWRPEKLIVRIDRTDPIKNIVRGFLAFERMLLNHPEWSGRVQFWAFLQPSRQDVPAYTEYLARVRSTAARINSELGRFGWEPIRLELRESLKRAVAAYKAFDVLLVNSIYDGMNLVAKEGMLLNERDGVLVLSENAGAHEEVGKHAVSVNPFDVGATADALHRGLTMPVEERRLRALQIKSQICGADITQWLRLQLEDIRELAPRGIK